MDWIPATPQRFTRPSGTGLTLRLAAVGAAYALLAYIGNAVSAAPEHLATLWIPNALLVGLLLRTHHDRAAYFVGASLAASLAVNLLIGEPWLVATTLAIANLLEVVVAVLAVRRVCGPRPAMDDLRNVGWILASCAIAPLASALVAAVVIAPATVALNMATLQRWMLAHSLSLMIVSPIVMIAIDAWHARRTPQLRDLVEWSIFVIGIGSATALIFGQTRFPFLFLACPLVIIAAFRFRTLGTAVATTVIWAIASYSTVNGYGPIMLVRGTDADRLIALQLFLATSFAMGLPVAAALATQAASRRELKTALAFNRSILDSMQDVVFKTDREGRWVFLSAAWETMTGYTTEESRGWMTARLFHEEDRRVAATIYPKIESGEIGEIALHPRFYTKAGECRHIEVMLRRLIDDSGAFAGTTGLIRDVTDRIKLSEELVSSEVRFERMAEAAPVGIFRADATGSITYVNERWCRKIGLTLQEALGDGWMRALKDASPYADDPAWAGFNAPGDIRHRTVCFRGATGEDLWVETVNSAEFDESGQITGYVGVIVDVTEQRHAIDQSIASERRFEAIASAAPAGMFRTDHDGLCTYVNEAWLRITGLAPGEWEGEGWSSALHPEDRDRVFDGWFEAVRVKADYRAEFRWVKPDGLATWVDVLGRPEFGEDGAVTGFIGVTLDITQRREAEAALRERDEQLVLLATNATDAVFRLGLDGTCLYASPSARELLGVDSKHLIGVRILQRFHPDDEGAVMTTFAALAKGTFETATIAYRSELVGLTDTYRWLEAHCRTVRDATGQPSEVIASIRDVSASKALEAELKSARERAEGASAAKAEFLANMSHEIRTPMNGVMGFAELLLADALGTEQRRHVQMIAESGRAMMRLLNDILDVSKIEAGQMQIAAEPIDIRHRLKACIALMAPIAEEKGVAVTLDVDRAVPEAIVVDALRLRQVLLNLLGNAMKFTARGSIRMVARIASTDGNGELVIDVVDTGIGIPENKLTSIFQQFSQADASTARRYGGTGLGLSISGDLARLMGGRITVTSEVGAGSIFTLALPLVEATAGVPVDDACHDVAMPLPAVGASADCPRILIAEDHPINQVLVTALARSIGLEPTIVANGREAIDAVARATAAGTDFALVLMDVQMPEMGGIEATRQIRARGVTADRLPIIALTANAYAEDVRSCLDAGMQEHLSKPIAVGDLRAAVDRQLNRPTAATVVAKQSSLGFSPGLHVKYRRRRDDAFTSLQNAMAGDRLDDAVVEDLVSMLHKLAGTAGSFGEPTLGVIASDLERALSIAPSEQRRSLLAVGLSDMQAAV